MKKNKLKSGLISDFFGRKSQKTSSSPHVSDLEVEFDNQTPPIQDETVDQDSPSDQFQVPPQNETTNDQINVEDKFVYDIDLLPHDPGKRFPISSYPPNDQDSVRRKFIAKGACQPRNHDFPQTNYGNEIKPRMHRFQSSWFDSYHWLEYSVEKDAAFCFVCYLFKDKTTYPGGDKFVSDGFRGWNRANERFLKHIGPSVSSAHRLAQEKYDFFVNPKSSIVENFNKTTKEDSILYKARLTHSLDCVKYLLRQGLAFRGHDESKTSSNKGNFLELLDWLAEKDENVNKLFKKSPKNAIMTCGDIQKELIHACAKETTSLILQELGDDYFGILADESSDVSHKEQLAICLRFVDKKGRVCERFLGVVKVDDTCSLSLKEAITKMIVDNKLSMSKVRGQGYDGASNMKGHIHGLKTLIMSETPSAYYIHCYAHQLQLTLVAVAKDNHDCKWFFEQVGFLLNLMGVSSKRKEMLRVAQAQKIVQGLEVGEISSGQGLHQEFSLPRPCDTRWGSYYRTILNIITLYPFIFEVILDIGKNGHNDDRLKAQTVMLSFESFQFIFMARLMLVIFGYTDDLCKALQRKDQDIVNAMRFVQLTKERLQKVRDDGWEHFLSTVTSFCSKNDIEVPNMDDNYVPPGRSRRYFEKVTNLHRFRIDMFLSIIDLQLQELNNRFDEVNMELLICMSCFSPIDSFVAFDKEKILKLATFYSEDFSSTDLLRLEFQLDHFIDDVRKDVRFEGLKDIGQVSMMLIETNKHVSYGLVYLLIRLVLILPVATANVERAFSAMTYVKNKLRNSMGDQLLTDCLVTFIEKDVFRLVKTDDILDSFQREKTRRVLLPPCS